MLITIPYTEMTSYEYNKPVEISVLNKGIKISAGVVEDDYNPKEKIKVKKHYEICVVLENGSVYVLHKCPTQKGVLSYFNKIIEKIAKGAKIAIVSNREAKVL